MLVCIIENMYPNYSVIPCFVEKIIPKQHLKFVLYQNKVNGFLLQVLPTFPIFLFHKKRTPKRTPTPLVSSFSYSLKFPPVVPSQVTSL